MPAGPVYVANWTALVLRWINTHAWSLSHVCCRRAENVMIGRTRKLPSAPKKPRASQQDRKHLNELLDEALEETFPASDALEMLEPAPNSPQTNHDRQK
jgi:hypothetical protein